MRHLKNFIIVMMLTAIVAPFLSATLSAHETRLIGDNEEYKIVIGFDNEPAFEDVINSPVLIISRASDDKPIDDSLEKPDIVDLQLEVEFRDAETFDSAILDSAMLAKPRKKFGTENTYKSSFKPTHDGTYAFHVTGVISDESDPQAGPLNVDETFVCGEGSQSAHGFGCVQDPQIFPGKLRRIRGEDVDKDGYKDNEGF